MLSYHLDQTTAIVYFLSCTKSVLDRLQRVQNAAARLVLRAKRYDSATPMFYQLHWLKVPERIEFKSCLTTFKCLNNLAPSYLSDFCLPLSTNSTRMNLRSSESGKLFIPKCKTVYYGDKSFPVAGPRLWNDLPNTVRSSQSVDAFKRNLKTHLFMRSYSTFSQLLNSLVLLGFNYIIVELLNFIIYDLFLCDYTIYMYMFLMSSSCNQDDVGCCSRS